MNRKIVHSMVWLFGLVLCMMLLGMTASAEDFIYVDAEKNQWKCVDNGEEAWISGVYYQKASMDVEIPAYVYDTAGNQKTVTAVTNNWPNGFSFRSAYSGYEMHRLVLPDTVSLIHEGAFENFIYLAEVVFPQNPDLYIGPNAFSGCTNLQKVTFRVVAGSMQPVEIGSRAFADCVKLTELTFPVKTTMDTDALDGCTGLKKIVNAPAGIDMGASNVKAKYALEEVYFAEGLTAISGISIEGDAAPAVKKVVLPSTVQTIGADAFAGLSQLSSINLPAGLREIGDRAFRGCKSLKIAVNYPAEDLSYNDDFKDSGITSISFGENMISIIIGSFTGCPNLTSISVAAGGSSGFHSKDGILYSYISKWDGSKYVRDGESLFAYPAGKSWAGSYTVPADVKGINTFAFDSCRFTEIQIPVNTSAFFNDYRTSWGTNERYPWYYGLSSNCQFKVVKGSYADDALSGTGRRVVYTKGPSLKITYRLNGGTNSRSNPSSMAGGESITLSAPTRSGYRFLGWSVGSASSSYVTTYAPSGEQLYEGVTFVANWQKQSSPSSGGSKPSKVKAPGKVRTLKLSNAQGKSFKASYSKVSGASGYEILTARDKRFKTGRKLVSTKKTAASVKNLKAGKTYYVKVRAYKTDGSKKVYGAYSPVKKISTISVGKPKSLKAKNSSGKKIAVTLSSVKGAKGYEILCSTDKKFKKGRKRILTRKRKASFTKLSKGKTYYIKARAYKLNAQKKKVYGAYTKTVKVKVKK